VTGLQVAGNTIRGGYMGVNYQGTVQSTVANNRVTGSTGAGIAVTKSMGQDGEPIHYPSGSTIFGNIAWANAIDLLDDETGHGNTWAGNVCGYSPFLRMSW
jgi:hypothetical protein